MEITIIQNFRNRTLFYYFLLLAISAFCRSDDELNSAISPLECAVEHSKSQDKPDNDFLIPFWQSLHWEIVAKGHVNLGFMHDTLWCRQAVNNNSQWKAFWHLVITNTRLDMVTFYWFTNGSILPADRKIAGELSSIEYQRLAYPVFKFSTQAYEKGWVYFSVKSSSVFWFTSELLTEEAYWQFLFKRNFIQYSYAILILGGLLLHLSGTKKPFQMESLHLYLFILFSGLYLWGYFGDGQLLIRQISLWAPNIYLYLCSMLSLFFILTYIRYLLNVEEMSAWLDKIYCLLLKVMLLAISLVPVSLVFNGQMVKLYSALAFLLTCVVAISIALFLRQPRNKVSWYSLSIILCVCFAVVCFSSRYLGLSFLKEVSSNLPIYIYPAIVVLLIFLSMSRHRRLVAELESLRSVKIEQTRPQISQGLAKPTDQAAATARESLVAPVPEASFPKSVFDARASRIYRLDATQTMQVLTRLIEQEKSYLDPDLTLNKLATKMKIRPDQLSAFINSQHSKSFSRFINDYRVSESIDYLQSATSYSLLEIAFKSGFNSRSNFNRVFKKHTGQSPAHYRLAVHNEAQ